MTTTHLKMRCLLFFICFGLFTTTNIYSQQVQEIDYEKAKTQLQKERETIFIEALQLSVTQASVFHPIYVQFNKEKRVLDDMLISLFLNYGNNYQKLNKKLMSQFVKQSEEYQRKELSVRKKYYKILSEVISVEIGSQFYEVDDFISTSLRLNILTGLPFTGRITKQSLSQQVP